MAADEGGLESQKWTRGFLSDGPSPWCIPHVSVHSPNCNLNVCSSSCAHICSSLFLFIFFFKRMICMRLCACMCSWCMNTGAAGPYGARGRQSVPASPQKTTESEKQVYLRGGSQRAFPRSLIRDSDSAEEVRGRGGWAGGDGGGGLEQDVQVSGGEGTVAKKMDLWGPLNAGSWVFLAKWEERVKAH